MTAPKNRDGVCRMPSPLMMNASPDGSIAFTSERTSRLITSVSIVARSTNSWPTAGSL